MIDAVLNAEQLSSICPLFSSGGGVNASHPCLPALVFPLHFLHCLPYSLIHLLPYLLPLSPSPRLPSTPHRAVTILRENPFLFTQIITLLLFVIEPCCLVNGIVLEYNTQLNGAVVDPEYPEVALKLSGCCTVL